MTDSPKISRKTANQAFFEELREIKKALPEGWRSWLIRMWPADYDTSSGLNHVNAVMAFRSTDTVLLERLKEYIRKKNEGEL